MLGLEFPKPKPYPNYSEQNKKYQTILNRLGTVFGMYNWRTEYWSTEPKFLNTQTECSPLLVVLNKPSHLCGYYSVWTCGLKHAVVVVWLKKLLSKGKVGSLNQFVSKFRKRSLILEWIRREKGSHKLAPRSNKQELNYSLHPILCGNVWLDF